VLAQDPHIVDQRVAIAAAAQTGDPTTTSEQRRRGRTGSVGLAGGLRYHTPGKPFDVEMAHRRPRLR
jgi:hypothetical protein